MRQLNPKSAFVAATAMLFAPNLAQAENLGLVPLPPPPTAIPEASETAPTPNQNPGGIKPNIQTIKPYDVLKGPLKPDGTPMFDPIPTPQEFLGENNIGKKSLKGANDLLRALEDGVRDGERLKLEAPKLDEADTAKLENRPLEEMKFPDVAAKFRQGLSDSCVSYRERDIYNCGEASINNTLGIADFFIAQLSTLKDLSLKDFGRVSKAISQDCEGIFNSRIKGKTFANTLDYFATTTTTSRYCMKSIAYNGASIGVDFMKSTRDLMINLTNEAEQNGKIDFDTLFGRSI